MSSFWFIAAQNLMTATCQKEIFFYDGHFDGKKSCDGGGGGGGAVRYNHSIAMLLDQSSPLIFHREDAKNKLDLFK